MEMSSGWVAFSILAVVAATGVWIVYWYLRYREEHDKCVRLRESLGQPQFLAVRQPQQYNAYISPCGTCQVDTIPTPQVGTVH